MNSIVGLFTDVLPAGGVQRAGRHVAAVTAKFASERGLSCNFLSLNDPTGPHAVRVGGMEFPVCGHAGNKTQLVRSALRAAAHSPALVIALHPHLAPAQSFMKRRAPHFRSMVFAHGVEVWQPLGWVRGTALRRADLVLGPSEDTVRHLICDQRISPAKVRRLPWGLDPEFEARVAERASLLAPPEFPKNARVILTVGRWDAAEKYKGADTLIAALPRVLQSTPNASLVLVGDGDDRPRLEQLARSLHVDGHTHFLSSLSSEQLAACYSNCDVFALPSRGEGFGMVFLEAMAYGKPVIGGAHAGVPDIIEDGKTGFLVPHGNIDRLAQAIEFILADYGRAALMGSRGRERVVSTFSFARFQANLEGVLSDILADNAAID
jgi:glycosyltransferase involved in cell wall biosynthesis